MTTTISTSGIQLLLTNNLLAQQKNLSKLNEQLGSGVQNNDLTDYTPAVAFNLVNFQNTVTQRQSYIDAMKNASTRLSAYDTTLGNMENIATTAQNLAQSNQSLDPSTVSQLHAQAQSYLKQLTDDLNQQIGGRYIYSGSRYSTAPVVDLTTLSGTPSVPFNPTVSPAVANYDTSYVSPGPTNTPSAWATDSVSTDINQSLTYGVNSNNPAFQQLVAGLQLLSAATAPGVDATTYNTDIVNAGNLLGTALNNVQGVHSGVSSNISILKNETDLQNTDINNLKNQIGDLQNADITQVGTSINLLQTQLQASYSATASLTQDSILKYL